MIKPCGLVRINMLCCDLHVAFAIATATICMVNCLCVVHAHVFVGCSNLSPHPVWWDSPSPVWHTWLRNPSSPVAPLRQPP
jgi:hypothetical protein